MDMHASPPSGLPPESSAGHGGPRGPHPSEETLAAFLDGRLPASERAEVEAHVADCAECLEILSESAAFLEEEEDEEAAQPVTVAAAVVQMPAPRPRSGTNRRWVLAAGGALAAAALLALAVRGLGDPTEPPKIGIQ